MQDAIKDDRTGLRLGKGQRLYSMVDLVNNLEQEKFADWLLSTVDLVVHDEHG